MSDNRKIPSIFDDPSDLHEDLDEVFAEDLSESFDKFMEGVVAGEIKNRARKTLNEDSPARKYIKRYGELPQNRTVFKR